MKVLLMFSICWDCGAGMTEMKQYWAELRTEAVNALVRYFGSINSGSIGWCTTDSEYYNVNKDGRCWPTMAKQGMLPWMNSDGTPKATCPWCAIHFHLYRTMLMLLSINESLTDQTCMRYESLPRSCSKTNSYIFCIVFLYAVGAHSGCILDRP